MNKKQKKRRLKRLREIQRAGIAKRKAKEAKERFNRVVAKYAQTIIEEAERWMVLTTLFNQDIEKPSASRAIDIPKDITAFRRPIIPMDPHNYLPHREEISIPVIQILAT